MTEELSSSLCRPPLIWQKPCPKGIRVFLFIFVLLGGLDGTGRIWKTGETIGQASPKIFDAPDRNKDEHDCFHSLGQMQRNQREVDDFDADKRRNESANSVDEEIANQNLRCANGAIFNSGKRERNQHDDDERVENDSAQDRA